MDIIPVLDLMDGLVVHARRGQRQHYRPLRSPLCAGAAPAAVVTGLLKLHCFRTFYLADLDALMGRPAQTAVLLSLRRAFPHLRFWVDRGLPAQEAGFDSVPVPGAVPVIGSESLAEQDLRRQAGYRADFVLSLDFRDGRLEGPEVLLERPDWWPRQVILMNLGRVGAGIGPDFAQARAFIRDHPSHAFVAAGGVRGGEDLRRLGGLGVSAVLLASALHAGAVDARVLREWETG